jgi:hypothetical protein
MSAKRDIFRELQDGVSAMKGHRQGKLTLRSYKVEPAPLPDVDSREGLQSIRMTLVLAHGVPLGVTAVNSVQS